VLTNEELQGYIELIEIITSAGLQTFDQIKGILSSHVSPDDLGVILGEVQTRLDRRKKLATSTGA
jgi:hypothetical protein